MKKVTRVRSKKNLGRVRVKTPLLSYYTSGTTGLPKGACLSHRALIQTARSFLRPLSLLPKKTTLYPTSRRPGWGIVISLLYRTFYRGPSLNFPEEPETLAQDTREVGPNFIIYGPRQWESLVSDIQVKMLDAHLVEEAVYRLFLPVGFKMADMQLARKKISVFWKMLYAIANGLLFHPLKDKLGLSRVRFAVTGSSVLSLDTFRFIHALGIALRQNYGSTEAGYISSHSRLVISALKASAGRSLEPKSGLWIRASCRCEARPCSAAI